MKIKYRLYYFGLMVDGISTVGSPIINTDPKLYFDTMNAAMSFLKSCTYSVMEYNHSKLNDMRNYHIVEEHISEVNIKYDPILGQIDDMISGFIVNEKVFSGILLNGITYGFKNLGFSTFEKLNTVLNNPKYSTVIEKTVPGYILSNLEDFYETEGISTCSQDVLSAIILTSDDDMLNRLEINKYIKNTSK